MPARKKADNAAEKETYNLQEILQDDGSTEYDNYSNVDSVAIQRLIYAVSSLGGMVTFWYDNNNKRLCFSMRLFGGHKSYQIDDAAQFTQISEPIIGKLTRIMQEKKLPPLPPLTAPKKGEK